MFALLAARSVDAIMCDYAIGDNDDDGDGGGDDDEDSGGRYRVGSAVLTADGRGRGRILVH